MTRIVLVQHGHVEGISPERFRGRRDIQLSDLGARQARATAQRIAEEWKPRIAYTSSTANARLRLRDPFPSGAVMGAPGGRATQ